MGHIISHSYRQWPLEHRSLSISGLNTSYYHDAQIDPNKPNILLVHGIGGDHHGMMPLGYELREQYNVYFVELPGHGQTALPEDRSLTYWKLWADGLAKGFAEKGVHIDEVIGHSFGCIAIAHMASMDAKRYVMIAPVPKPSATYATYARVMSALKYLVGLWYGRYVFALWRGVMMMYRHTRESLEVIRWVSKKTRYTQKQLYYHMSLAEQTEGANPLHGMTDQFRRKLRILIGSHDSIQTEDYFEFRDELPDVCVRLLPGGHLLPIESPKELAREILEL